MPINYALYKNHLTADPDDYSAMVEITAPADTDDIIQRVLEQGSTVTEPDLRAAAADLVLATISLLKDGRRVHFFGMADFFPRVKGIFTGPTDGFDPARHQIDVGANPGARVRDEVRKNATAEKVEALKPAPNPLEYRDIGSDTTDDQVTVGNIGELSGNRLKFDETAADEGVYFVATAGGDTKVTTMQKNKPSQGVFLVPATLIAGTYHLEVRARMGLKPEGVDNRELRMGRLDATLTV